MLRIVDIEKFIDEKYEVMGDRNRTFVRISHPKDADELTLVFIKENKEDLLNTKAGIIICSPEIEKRDLTKCFVVVDRPQLLFAKVGNFFFKKPKTPGIDKSAILDPYILVGQRVYIGPFSYIGSCKIGEDTYISGHCHIFDPVSIGNRVRISPGCVIGNEGFGWLKDGDDNLIDFPHMAKVVIEDDVEIKSNVVIDRGALTDTVIGRGSKINNGSHIGHNVVLGKSVNISPHCIISGGCKIGDDSYIAGNTIVRDGIIIGNKVVVGMGSVVTKDIPDGEIWFGNPAKKKDKQ